MNESSDHFKDPEQDSSAEPLPNPSLDNAPDFKTPSSSAAQDLLALVLPPDSPPLQRDLFVQSAFSTVVSSNKPVARLSAVIHTSPETLKEYLNDFGSKSSGKVDAVVHRTKENGDCVVAHTIRAGKVRRRALLGAFFTWNAPRGAT